ncbi:hypothetical protein A3F65_03360 [Candidatus Saccharibacteria bacterium RIFCSPHIGHO2_12_FULL_47_16b]|nr:MAG: hypothetical protein A3F65_03360 [Candidatus Saccharibacteria bacterium RIFCSPHIGHO2_12_FULL_47_16b]OGL40026.1 MAG: hypothetical protein A3J32_03585 [Candidatus Saccharibacteria bacterium RIFCSPLOWO2_02_FULL_46_7]
MSANRKKLASQKQAGYTVPELTIATTVTAILFIAFLAAMTNYFFTITRNNAAIDMTVNSQNLLRNTVEALRLGDGVRQSNSINDPNAPPGGWNTSNDDFVIVIAEPAKDANREYIIDPLTGTPYINEVVYYKSGSLLLKRTLANPNAAGNTAVTSCPSEIATPECPADSILAEYVDSMVFSFYDQDGISTSDPLLARSIKIDLSMKRTTFASPLTLDNSIRVTLRNRFSEPLVE